MRRTICALEVCLGVMLTATASAQIATEQLEMAQELVAAERWEEALDLLLQVRAASTLAKEELSGLLSDAGRGLYQADNFANTLLAWQAALALDRDLHAGRDHVDVANGLHDVALCLQSLDRPAEALQLFGEALAMNLRIHGESDHLNVAICQCDLAGCLHSLERAGEALPHFESALAMYERLQEGADHPRIAMCMTRLALCLNSLDRWAEALPHFEAALAMRRRIYGERDDPLVALSLDNVAGCLKSLGRAGEALPHLVAALAMKQRLFGETHPRVAFGLSDLANCLDSLGRGNEALPYYSAALATYERLTGGADDPDVAMVLNDLASCIESLGRAGEALPQHEAALAMWRRIYGEADHPAVAMSMTRLAVCLDSLGRASEALPLHEAALAMRKRVGDAAEWTVASGMADVASCLESLGRAQEALPYFEESLAMRKRIYGDADHPDVAIGMTKLAACLSSLGFEGRALPQYEAALAMRRRIFGETDNPDVAISLNCVGGCLDSLGRAGEALPQFEAALAMRQRIYGEKDHPDVANSLNSVAGCLDSLGRAGEALPQFEAALAMRQRIYGQSDHPDIASGLNSVASCLHSLGRAGEALPQFEAALAMRQRIYGENDHPDVAISLNNVACCLDSLGHAGEALSQYLATLAMQKRIYGDNDHPDVATSLNNVACCLDAIGRADEALPQFEAASAMRQRIYGEADHPDVASGLSNVAHCLRSLGRADEALPQFEAALAMRQRIYGEADHPDVASTMNHVASCLDAIGRASEALPVCEQAVAMIERLRDTSRTSEVLRQSFFDSLKAGGAFEQLQKLAVHLGKPVQALCAAERGRGRELLDLLEQQRLDVFEEAALQAHRRGDETTAGRIAALRAELETADTESSRLLRLLTQIDAKVGEAERDTRRQDLLVQSNRAATHQRQLLDERARLLRDTLPVGRVLTPVEIQSSLQEGELLLEFTFTANVSLLYVLAPEGTVDAIELPTAVAMAERTLPAVLAAASHAALTTQRGRDPDPASGSLDATAQSRELFASLIPASLWPRLRAARRVFVAAHRELHRLPFELLVTDQKNGVPVYWLDDGPPVTYVPSGSALHWLRQRRGETPEDPPDIDLLAIGDPGAREVAPGVPERGAFVAETMARGQGNRIDIQAHDVLLRYDGTPITDAAMLGVLQMEAEAAIAAGTRPDHPIPIDLWRSGEVRRIEVQKGLLGIQLAAGAPRLAYEASLRSEAQMERILRHGDLERVQQLPRLSGARAEAEAITKAWTDAGHRAQRLLGEEATEPAVFEVAGRAKYLHFACHGIAEEYAGQSLSMLVLSQPQHVLPGDDGLLKLGDLLHNWRGHLSCCRLVVLSACRTNVGPTLRDEAPQALPIGFLFAGAPAVISSLWAVDDASTRELMTDFYSRLLAGETDKLKAFTDAKKALRQKYPDPFHWAPFLYMGAPD